MSERPETGITVNLTNPLLLLTAIFVGLKLGGYIDWSWWAVLLPIWFFPAFIIVMIGFVLILGLIVVVFGQ